MVLTSAAVNGYFSGVRDITGEAGAVPEHRVELASGPEADLAEAICEAREKVQMPTVALTPLTPGGMEDPPHVPRLN